MSLVVAGGVAAVGHAAVAVAGGAAVAVDVAGGAAVAVEADDHAPVAVVADFRVPVPDIPVPGVGDLGPRSHSLSVNGSIAVVVAVGDFCCAWRGLAEALLAVARLRGGGGDGWVEESMQADERRRG